MEDQYEFFLGHRIMKKQSDAEIAVPFVEAVKSTFPDLKSCSYEKRSQSIKAALARKCVNLAA